jgi:hypothetical protein
MKDVLMMVSVKKICGATEVLVIYCWREGMDTMMRRMKALGDGNIAMLISNKKIREVQFKVAL